MVRAACHCTAVRLEIGELPTWVLDCNCTLCRRYGAIWAYPAVGQVKVISAKDATETYVWLDGDLAFHRCKQCGSVVYMEAVKENPRVTSQTNEREPRSDHRFVCVG